MSKSPQKSILKALLDYLKNEVRDLDDFIDEFPEANHDLDYPAISVFEVSSEFRYKDKNEIKREADPNDDKQIKIFWDTGFIESQLQLDLWTTSKENRYELVQEILDAFNSKTERQELILELDEYHDIVCSYTLTGSNPGNSEEAAQRKEWRQTFTILADTRLVKVEKVPIMTDYEINVETQTTPLD